VADRKETEIEALKKRVLMAQGVPESEFATGQAKALQQQLEAMERGKQLDEVQRRGDIEAENLAKQREQESKALGPTTGREAAVVAMDAANELRRQRIAKALLEKQVPTFAKMAGVGEEELRKRLGLAVEKVVKIPLERAAGVVQRFDTGRFGFGNGAMGSKAQNVEDKTAHKLLGEVVKNTSSGARWG